MTVQPDRIDRVTLLGAIISLASLAPPFLVVKPNRIVAGTAVSLFSLDALWPAIITILAAASLVGALAPSLLSRSRHSGDRGAGSRGPVTEASAAPTASPTAGTTTGTATGSGTVVSQALAIGRLVVGAGLFLVPWLAVGASAPALLTAKMAAGRISATAGIWLQMLGAYVILNAALRDLRTTPTARVPEVAVRIAVPAFVVILFAALGALLVTGHLDSLGIVKEYLNHKTRFFEELGAHLMLTGVAVAAAVVIGVPLGIVAWRQKAFEQPVFVFVNGIQTIPSLALFGIMIAPLAWLSHQFPVLRQLGIQGIGNAPALIALALYALLPITRNTYTSLSVIDRGVIDAGRGMGMSRWQMLRLVEFPLSLPIILGGIRTSAVQAVGNTAVAALIGAGGLGAFVFQGLGQAAPDLILMGVFPIILLAVLVDRTMKYLVRYLTPEGIRHERETAGASA